MLTGSHRASSSSLLNFPKRLKGVRLFARKGNQQVCLIIIYKSIIPDHCLGVFLDNAMMLVPIPPWSEDDMNEYFKTAAQDAVAHGLTSIHDAEAKPEMIAFYKK